MQYEKCKLMCHTWNLCYLLQLVDFESWKTILARSEKNSGSIGSNGAICVLPNSLEKRHLDIQGNIYAFGVILLELISGRPPYCKEKGCLVTWVRRMSPVSIALSSKCLTQCEPHCFKPLHRRPSSILNCQKSCLTLWILS